MMPMLLSTLALANAAFRQLTSPAALLEKRGTLFALERQGLHFELFLPNTWQPGGSPLPVLVFLHGRGESGHFHVTNAQSLPLQLLSNRSFAASFGHIAIVPQCPAHCAMANHWLAETLQARTPGRQKPAEQYPCCTGSDQTAPGAKGRQSSSAPHAVASQVPQQILLSVVVLPGFRGSG